MFSAAKTSGPSGYNINNSLRFRASATAFLQRTPASASNRRTFTLSTWVKRGLAGGTRTLLSVNQNSSYGVFDIIFGLDAADDLGVYQNSSGTNTLRVATAAVFRDYSAWYHVVAAIDTTQATPADRVKIYVNGVQQTVNIGNQVPLNTDLWCNNTMTHNIGKEQTLSGGSGGYLDGYLAEYHFIDGQALTPSSFGSTNATTGVWQPAKYTGTYGTNGFYLKFSDIATTSGSNAGLGKDFSGNGNYWNTNNISVTSGTTYDAMTDVPTLTSATVANYCVANPLDSFSTSVISNANLTVNVSGSATGSGGCARCNTINFTGISGKWYWEMFVDNAGTGAATLRLTPTMILEPVNVSSNPSGFTWYWRADGLTNLTGAGSFATNDILMFAYDSDTGKLWAGKNGTWVNSGVPSSGTGQAYTLTALASYALVLNYGTSGGGTGTASFNYGQRPFSYTPPTGFVAVNTYNLPTSTIVQGNKYMDATLYTGTSAVQSITNAGSFKPDYLWIKCRSTINNNSNFDSTRGVLSELFSNLTDAQYTATDGFTAFNSNGFSLDNSGSGGNVNVSGRTYVAWQWNANNGTTSSNTNGSITSTVQANTTAGFSIVTYTGTGANATVGHGLGVAPKMIIVKQRGGATSWNVYHTSIGAGNLLYLEATNASTASATTWNSTSPTSTVFSIGTAAGTNTNTGTYVAYCWAEIAGFSKFGSYTGNGSADGPFIFTGFRPKFIMIKCTSNADSWYMLDTSRSTYNATNQRLFANASSAESSGDAMDILSNGFKNRSNTTLNNLNGGTYIYAAFAENPFKNALAR